MFNLVIDVDPNEPNILIVEPRNDYYETGDTLDWTTKIDISSIKTALISDLMSKKTILSYKTDGDYLNSEYERQTKEIYGQQIYIFDNDFITDELKLECNFSPTPIISINNYTSNMGSFPLSRIAKDVEGGQFGSNIRVMLKNLNPIPIQGAKKSWYLWNTVQEGAFPTEFTEIPWAGHLDNPYSPTEDLNFGQVYTSSFEWGATKNTLYNKYWKDYLDLINNPTTKILTANFLLDEVDIANFKFKNVIMINISGTWMKFIVNKISDYNPSIKGLTQVELIKI